MLRLFLVLLFALSACADGSTSTKAEIKIPEGPVSIPLGAGEKVAESKDAYVLAYREAKKNLTYENAAERLSEIEKEIRERAKEFKK
ncbi:hypothetical protein KAI87_12320 [Myxococcota bacterium]|nr:hypothetical protein [Myxococcota bacterium]